MTRSTVGRSKPRTLVLGVDPGSVRTGWALVERQRMKLRSLDAGVIQAGKGELPARLQRIYTGLLQVMERHTPETMAVEDIFFARSSPSALKLGHARGVVLLAAAHAELSVHAYPPSLVKRSIAGNGRAGKAQVAQVVAAILGLKTLPGEDATDALAIAITHVNAAPMRR